jgi:hypothetical protein
VRVETQFAKRLIARGLGGSITHLARYIGLFWRSSTPHQGFGRWTTHRDPAIEICEGDGGVAVA